MSKLLRAIEIVKKRLNPRLRITGIIPTRFDARRRLNREVVSKIRERFGNTVFDTIIRENIALAEAPSYGKTIYDYSPTSYGAEDFMTLSHEIIQRNDRARTPKRS
jgi:chromosome partitioning protein